MKKLKTLLLVLCSCFLLGGMLTSCGEEHTHSLTKVEAKIETCEEDGNSEYYTCPCGKFFSDENGANEIQEDSWVILKKGHAYENYQSNGDATCTENGTETGVCIRCPKEDTREEVDSKLGHAFGTWESNGDGTHSRVCANDPSHVETVDCAGGLATCTEKAVCEECHTAYGSYAQHVFEEEVVSIDYLDKGATCKQKATYFYSCVCGEKGSDTFEYGELGDHEWDAGECSVCKREYFSDGLQFTLSTVEAVYSVSGRGDCKDTNIVIPSTYQYLPVTKIDSLAFADERDVVSITIPESVKEIDGAAFKGCTGLKTIVLPSGITRIDDYTFQDCTALQTITIPKKVESIGFFAFYNCLSLGEITLLEDNALSVIENYAFCGCIELKEMILPATVTRIGKGSFEGCEKLESISLPFVGDPGNGSDCEFFGYIFGAASHTENATKVPASLKTVAITGSAHNISAYAFAGCSNIEKITIASGITTIGSASFKDCTALAEFIVPATVTSMGTASFEGCTALKKITVPFVGNTLSGTSNTFFGYIFGASTYSDNGKKVPANLEEVVVTGGAKLGNNAFYGCSSIKKISLPEGLKSIGSSAFASCTGLANISLPKGITALNDYTFNNCTALTKIEIPDGVTGLGSYVFYGCTSLKNAIIPNTVTTIGQYVFMDCTGLESLSIPFVGNALTGASKTFIGYFFGATQYSQNKTYVPATLKEVTLTGECSIEDYAFYGCSSITNISISDSVAYVGYKAFYNCSITYNTYEEGSYLGNANNPYAVLVQSNNKSAVQFTIHKDTKAIAGAAFLNCESLQSIKIPEGVKSIGYCAFRYCNSLEEVVIPNSVVIIGRYAFGDCEGLKKVTIGSGVNTIYEGAFSTCTSLTTVIISSGVKKIDKAAFFNSKKITNVYYTGTSSQWYSINIGQANDPLTSAQFTFGYVL